MKKTISLILILTMLLAFAPAVYAEANVDTQTVISTDKDQYAWGETGTISTKVTYNDSGEKELSGAVVTLKLDGNDFTGTTLDSSLLTVGNHKITASYAGNDTYKESNSSKTIKVNGTSHNVSVTSSAHGTVTASPTSGVVFTDITLNVSPEDNYYLNSITGAYDGGTVTITKNSDTQYSFKMPNNVVTVSASFITGSAVSKDITKGTVNAVFKNTDYSYDISATPQTGNYFYKWTLKSGSGKIKEPFDSNTVLTLDKSDATAEAEFLDKQTYKITVTPTSGGKIDVTDGIDTSNENEKAVKLQENDKAEIKAIPDPGYYFAGWSVSGEGSLADNKASTNFTVGKSDAAITASFAEIPLGKSVPIPTAIAGLIYNGESQTGVNSDTESPAKYTFKDNSNTAIKAGSHDAVAVIADGYYWEDGIQEDKTIPWSIGKADTTITISAPVAAECGTEFCVSGTLSSFDNTAKTVDIVIQLTTETVNYSASSDADGKYSISNAKVSKAENGTITATFNGDDNHNGCTASITFKGVAQGKYVIIPTPVTGLKYDGTEQTGVNNPSGDTKCILTNYKATEAKTYNAKAKLASTDMYWEDGTQEDKEIEWSIAKIPVDIPTAVSGLTYNGLVQTGVKEDTSTPARYTFPDGSNKTDAAGIHNATAVLNPNCYWNDDTKSTTNKIIPWVIAKKKITPPDTSKTEYAYTGSDIKPIVSTSDYNISYPALIKDVGEYSTPIYLVDTANTVWTTGSSDAIPFNWHIGYTVYFDGNGGSSSLDKMITGGNRKLSSMPTASKSQYSFAGWYTERTGGSLVSTATALSGNTTLYAHWSPCNYTVTAGKYVGGGCGRAYVSYDNGYSWLEITSTSTVTLGTFPVNTQILFKMVPYTGYYAHPYVYSSSGSYYSPSMKNYIFSVAVTDNINVKLNFTSTPPTGDTSIWQYIVAALSSAGLGTGAAVTLKRKKK